MRGLGGLLLDDLHHIFIVQSVLLAHLLRRVLDRRAPHQCTAQSHASQQGREYMLFELLEDGLVQRVAEVLNGVLAALQHNRRLVVGQLALGLGVAA